MVLVRMPELCALYLLVIAILVAVAATRFHVMPFLALTLATVAFAVMQGSSLPWTAGEFNTGFGRSISSAGLAVLIAAMVACLAEESGAAAHMRNVWRGRGLSVIAVLAGLGGSALAALAVLAPALRAAGTQRTRQGLTATYAVNAAHACLVPSPLPIAALAILNGDWRWALGIGAIVAMAQTLLGWALARRAPEGHETAMAPPSGQAAHGMVLALAVLIGLIIAQSFGQMPTEPLGGGNTREALLGLGRPMILLLAGLGVAIFTMGGFRDLSATGWIGRGAGQSLGVFLAIGAAGGFQFVLHNNGFAALLAEEVAAAPPALGIAVPLLVALVSRLLQGSPLTAAITAAGMMQPMLAVLGLDSEAGRGLVVVAIGVGAMSGPHVNDGYFWLACHHTDLNPVQGLRWITGGALAQGCLALAILSLLARLIL